MEPWETKPMPPFNKHLGFDIKEWRQGHIVIMARVKPEHYNHSGVPHGGFIATLIDASTALPGVFSDTPGRVRTALTLALNINFLGQARGEWLKAVGRVTASGRKIFYSAANIYDMDDTIIASGQGVFRYRSGSEAP